MTPQELKNMNIRVTDADYDLIGAYIPLARRTMSTTLTTEQRALNICYGLTGECGELADIYKKHLFHGHELDKDKVIKECGDIMWYLANAMYHMNTERVAEVRDNIERNNGVNRKITTYWKPLKRLYYNVEGSTENAEFEFDYKQPILELSHVAATLGHLILTPYLKTLYFSRTRSSTQIAMMIYVIKGVLQSVGSTLDECLQLNVDKLKKRYPEGFSTEESIARKDLQQ